MYCKKSFTTWQHGKSRPGHKGILHYYWVHCCWLMCHPALHDYIMCFVLLQDLEYDRRLQEVPRLLPSSLSLPAITAGEYCVNYVQQLRHVLHKVPPNQPTEMAIDMLAAVAQLQR